MILKSETYIFHSLDLTRQGGRPSPGMMTMGAILALLRRSGPIVVIVGAFAILPFLVHKFSSPLPVAMFDLGEVRRPWAKLNFKMRQVQNIRSVAFTAILL